MIGICDVSVQAANPNMPLYPLRAFVNSPSSLRIRNVPKRIGDWNISSVQLVVAYPDNTVKTVECKLIGNVWVGTVAGSSITGRCENGYTVFASGNDENGNPVSNYALGKGLVEILEADTELKPGADIKYVRIFDEEPETPKDGDVWQLSGAWYIYQDNQAWPIGDDSGLISQLSGNVQQNTLDIAQLSNEVEDQGIYINIISSKIPLSASPTNQLADKMWVEDQLSAKADMSALTAYATTADLSTKQDSLTPAQLSAVDSGITSAKVAQYDEAMTKFNYELCTIAPTSGQPIVLQSCFPITFTTWDEEQHTITYENASRINIVTGEAEPFIYIVKDTVTSEDLFSTDSNGVFIGVWNITEIKFNNTYPIENVTPVLEFPQWYEIQDRAINTISISASSSSTINLVFPTLVPNHARDFSIRVVASSGTYSTPPTLSASGVTLMNTEGTMPEIATDENAAKTTLVYFSEIAENTFLVKGEALETIS